MDEKALGDYLKKTPNADFEDVMFTFPEMSMTEAVRAVRRHRFAKALSRWSPLLLMGIALVSLLLILLKN